MSNVTKPIILNETGIRIAQALEGLQPSQSQVEEAVDAWLDENITNPDSPPLDRSLSSSSSAAPADVVGDIKNGGNLLSAGVKSALINIFKHVAYTDGNAQTYIEALEDSWEAKGTLSSISADFEQGSAVITEGDSLDSLRQYLTVTGTFVLSGHEYEEEILNYTLSGTLTEGTSTITVTYKTETDTFTVSVSEYFPAEYQKVEYIGATGTQHIILSSIDVTTAAELAKYEYDIDFKFDEWNSDNGTNIMAGFATSAGCWIGYNNTVGNIAMGTTSGCYFTDNNPTTRHEYHYSYSNGNGTFERDDESTITRSGSPDGTSNKFVLFSGWNNSDGHVDNRFHFIGKLYDFEITYDGETIMHLIPCYRKSDNVIGLYDVVNDGFYVNNGTGTFTKGSDV